MIGYVFTKHADRQLQTFPIQTQRFIVKKIKYYCAQESPFRYADAIEGEKGKVYRFRAGDYRVVFDWIGDHILVTKVADRKDAYKG